MRQKSICLLIFWYGDLPWYFHYFIHTCAYNSSIDFFIVTDRNISIANNLPNVRIVYMSIEEIIQKATRKLGFLVSIPRAYKICDFRPAFGFIFSDLIEGYDFWGHGDLDVIYGDIRYFMNDEILKTHDVISCRHDYLTGAFALFRNVERINSLFRKSRDYVKVFSNPQHFCFDEAGEIYSELKKGDSPLNYAHTLQSMTYLIRKEESEGRVKAYFDFIIFEGTPGDIRWNKGRVVYKDEYEGMLYHLVLFKQLCKRPKILKPIPDVFYFTPRKIISAK